MKNKQSNYSEYASARAEDFKVGDWVMHYNGVYPGRVIGVQADIGLVDVQYPVGWFREEPEELIPLNLFASMPPSPTKAATHSSRRNMKKQMNAFKRVLYLNKQHEASQQRQDIDRISEKYLNGFSKSASISREEQVLKRFFKNGL